MIKVNVASSTKCLDGFINFDNSVFLHIVKILPFATIFFPKKYQELLHEYKIANLKYDLRIWNCKKRLPFKDSTVDHVLCSHYLEHLYKEDGVKFLKNLNIVIKPGGSLHLIVPDLKTWVDRYIADSSNTEKSKNASDNINFGTILTHQKCPTFLYNFLEALGWFGLQHRYMYDKASALRILNESKFAVTEMPIDCPTYNFYRNDGSIHLYCIKPK
jgi:predicted SAM-dependent methyltransferase